MQPSRNDSDSADAAHVTRSPASSSVPPAARPAALAWSANAAGVLPVAVLAALPLWACFTTERSFVLHAAVGAMALWAFASPASAILACAGFIPLVGSLFDVFDWTPDAWTPLEPLVLAFLTGWLLRRVASPDPEADPWTRAAIRPARVLGVVIAASAVVELFAVQPAANYPWPFVADSFRFLYTRFFINRSVFRPLADAALHLEGLGLFIAAVMLVRRSRTVGREALAMLVSGAAGVAALNIVQLTLAWVATGGPWSRLLYDFRNARIYSTFPDPNAAGSYLTMGLVVAFGLAFAGFTRRGAARRATVARWRAFAWLTVAAIIVVGLWLTGSRGAFVAVVPASLVLLTLVPRVPRWIGWGSVAAAALVFVLLVPFVASRFNLPADSGRSLSQALSFRAETSAAALRMITDHPVFGVGVGCFFARSGEYFSPAFRALVPQENAHNNFLQVLAELGVVGFVPLLWLIGQVSAAVWAAWRSGRLPPAAAAGAAGLVAFILTWLSGHPLLVPEAAHPFWLALGAVTGLAHTGDESATPGLAGRRRLGPWIAVAIGLLAVASVPLRGRDAARHADLDEASIGMSDWEVDGTGVRFRILTDSSGQFYVPADAMAMRLPVRLAEKSASSQVVELEIRIDGQLANRIRVEDVGWQTVPLELPRLRQEEHYRAVRLSTFFVGAGASNRGTPTLQFGVPLLSGPDRRR